MRKERGLMTVGDGNGRGGKEGTGGRVKQKRVSDTRKWRRKEGKRRRPNMEEKRVLVMGKWRRQEGISKGEKRVGGVT